MKFIRSLGASLAVFAIVFASALPAFAVTTVAPTGNVTLFDNDDTTSSVIIYRDDDHTATGFRFQCTPALCPTVGATDTATIHNYSFKIAGENSYDWLSSGNASEDCSALTYAQCVTAIDTDAISNGQLDFSLATNITRGNAGFTAVTTWESSDLITKVGTWIVKILGGGLGLVDALIGWIIALVIIGVIVHLIFRGLRFLHILR